MGKINTILFDCDNTLVLSEDLAFMGSAELINEICRTKGVPLEKPFTGESLITEFVGQNFRGMVSSLRTRYGFDLTPEELEDYVRREEDVLVARIEKSLLPCDGVDAVLERMAASGRYTLAVVSSSAMRRVRASIDKVNQSRFFPGETVFSAANSLEKPTTKPDPAIYLHAMQRLGKTPADCVAVEDSRSGTLAGVRAGLRVIGYVGPYEGAERERMTKVLTDTGAVIIMNHWSEFEACLEKLDNASA